MNWIYPLTIIIYSISLFAYFIDFLQHNRKVNRLAFWLLSVVWLLQTVFFIIRAIDLNRLPIITPFEGLFFYAWVVVTLSLIINRVFRVDFLVFFVNIIGFVMMSFSLFTPDGDVPESLASLLISELLIIHVSMILLSYAGLTLAFAFSALYVLEHQMLKRKKWGKRLLRLGALTKLDQYAFHSTMFAFPLFLIGIILGFVWASIQFGELPWFDAKVISSMIVMCGYAVYLYQRVVKMKRGYFMALLNVACFLLILINYFLPGSLSTFHLWD
ncbi:cytochrome c biogenesis protein [Halalkalibacterium halodurans]|uniref:cytochrome C assembly family protein n=1 Tax=Halalkalibacterium halodurans TaxID=86665 RepID=UPI002E1CAFF0|nr:cytochrome c biogenesis protein [Halalkalibacterium halodurans]